MSYSAVVLADNPILYWRFEETSGANCADSSTSGFTGTAQNAFTRNVTSATGQLGVALQPNNGYVSTPSVAALNIAGANQITHEIWVFINGLSSVQALMSKGSTGTTGGYHSYVGTSGEVVLNDNFQGTHVVDAPNGTISAGNWYHIVLVRGASNANRIYVNGSQVGSSANNVTTIAATSEPFIVGGSSTDGTVSQGMVAGGKFDEAAVYNYGLSQAQVTAHYAARLAAAKSGGAVGAAATFAQIFTGFQLQGLGKGIGGGVGQGKGGGQQNRPPKPPQPPQSTVSRRRAAGDLRRKRG